MIFWNIEVNELFYKKITTQIMQVLVLYLKSWYQKIGDFLDKELKGFSSLRLMTIKI